MLDRTMVAVQKGRDRLQVTIDPLEDESAEESEEGAGFFDQDET